MTLSLLIILAACFLAFANGANDNFKGVSTLFGAGTANYRRALGWATACTAAPAGSTRSTLGISIFQGFSLG